ncbi:hypothetical protein GCM10007147_18590 [Nocardiopsis kunsanensis]|uniref:Uncharacterized protein n=1 Tax=Nocardiopsis kunsanensis TaxID=141693 RepID=A0A919CH97_9ACTN|nr:hypothetical protein [Nocardiopsis kunsanensis]GHD23400.1 hypothetical protein GCM10007147_18590 [Nocardiopsis kunsanensis]
MTTVDVIQTAGIAAVLAALILTLFVALLRLAALPLAAASLGLDRLATLAAGPLLTPSGGTR